MNDRELKNRREENSLKNKNESGGKKRNTARSATGNKKKSSIRNIRRLYIIVLAMLMLLAIVTGIVAFRQHTAAREASERQEQQQKRDILEKKKRAADKAAADKAAAGNKTATKPTTGGHIVCIDPGHQSRGDSTMEPNGPGSSAKKARVTGGTRGTTTGIYEYQLNLTVAEKLKEELTGRGYTVYMTRESNDVNISNKERAEYATSVGADITVRLHANGANGSGTNGAMTLVPSKSNPYVSGLAASSYNLGKSILDAYCQAARFKNLGVQSNDTMTGINFCTAPVTILEMGFMTNPSDDSNMNNEACQSKMVNGIANGIDEYFGYKQ